ncbi:hypothetical protein GQ54DRAFT_302997 [Martensiomyces pterosporus]|nr:hypothetical protein GQ54DRAFT_302997 [Martensiomyces pterosporus]
MGFMDIFYPSKKKKKAVVRPCEGYENKHLAYGDYWRRNTPACTCCSGHHHAHPTHVCTVRCNHTHEYAVKKLSKSKRHAGTCHGDPPPRYSLFPQTTHRDTQDLFPHCYATPIGQHKLHRTRSHPAHIPPPSCQDGVYIHLTGKYHVVNQ